MAIALDWIKANAWWFAPATVVGSVLMALGSLAITAWALVRLPHDYFLGPQPPVRGRPAHPILRAASIAVRNLFGLFLIALGVFLSLPGVPGQGLLTILLGLMLVDIPGKRRFEQWLVGRAKVAAAINAIRARYGVAPLELDPPTLQNDHSKPV